MKNSLLLWLALGVLGVIAYWKYNQRNEVPQPEIVVPQQQAWPNTPPPPPVEPEPEPTPPEEEVQPEPDEPDPDVEPDRPDRPRIRPLRPRSEENPECQPELN